MAAVTYVRVGKSNDAIRHFIFTVITCKFVAGDMRMQDGADELLVSMYFHGKRKCPYAI